MPLVTSKQILQAALANHFAVGAFNANNMEQIQGIALADLEERSPVILQVSQGAIRYAGLEFAAAMVRTAASLVDVPVVLHLDHGYDFEQNVQCLRAGFTSLMFDGSKKSFDDNVAMTRKITEIAHIAGIPVEAELGRVAQSTDRLTPEQVRALMTDPHEAKRFIELTGADSLAIACGSVHAMQSQAAELDIDLIKAIHEQIPNTPRCCMARRASRPTALWPPSTTASARSTWPPTSIRLSPAACARRWPGTPMKSIRASS